MAIQDEKLINMPPASPLAEDDILHVVQGPSNDIPVDAKVTTAALRSALITSLRETPAGTIDGVNALFALSFVPLPNSLSVFKNGLLQFESDTGDFTFADQTITFNPDAIPLPGDSLRAVYRK